MKPGRLLLAIAAASISVGTSVSALAVDALTFPLGAGSDISGSASGGYGWSFVPTTNLVVTSVGYFNLTGAAGGDPNIVVTIWAGTNTVIASYTGITNPPGNTDSIISTTIAPLSLTHGQLYTITAHTTPLASSLTAFAFLDSTGTITSYTFVVAPELGQYQCQQLSPGGTLSPAFSDPAQNSESLYFGPIFTYEISTPRPILKIAGAANHTVQLAWPTNAVGFSLQRSLAVAGSYAAVTNVPSVVGTNYLTTLASTNATGFFRLARPN